ncbi:MAG: MFS transporter [Myxococcales bacterium]|nr:MFS transporter [Myxococcales bacterium]
MPASPAYRAWVLFVLFLVYVVNFVDRQILSSLVGPIRAELGASDFQMGLLGGLAFAVLYSIAGIPIARLADTGNRRNVVTFALAAWSALTALCGTATSYGQLLLYRIGVGIGEAGGSAPSHALVADYFPAAQRGRALALLATGIHVGIFVGLVTGSQFSEDWRDAFVVVGLPGLALALLVRFTVREPERGGTDAAPPPVEVPTFAETLRTLLRSPTVVLVLAGASVAALSGYAFAFWGYEFFARVHDLDRPTIGWSLGLATAVGGGLGTAAGGQLGDRLGLRDPRWYGFVCAAGMLATLPLGAAALYAESVPAALAFAAAFLFAGAVYAGPMYAILQGLAPARMRTMAAALLFLCTNLIGLGAGPPIVGALNPLLEPAAGRDAIRHSLAIVTALNLPVAVVFVAIGRRLGRVSPAPGAPEVPAAGSARTSRRA